jgi:hypothetical protein
LIGRIVRVRGSTLAAGVDRASANSAASGGERVMPSSLTPSDDDLPKCACPSQLRKMWSDWVSIWPRSAGSVWSSDDREWYIDRRDAFFP